MITIEVGVREAKGSLSKLLKKVKNGAQVVITDRGCPVGKLIPVNKGDQNLSDRLKDLETRGILQVKNNRGQRKPVKAVAISKKVDVQRMLQEDRDRK